MPPRRDQSAAQPRHVRHHSRRSSDGEFNYGALVAATCGEEQVQPIILVRGQKMAAVRWCEHAVALAQVRARYSGIGHVAASSGHCLRRRCRGTQRRRGASELGNEETARQICDLVGLLFEGEVTAVEQMYLCAGHVTLVTGNQS